MAPDLKGSCKYIE